MQFGQLKRMVFSRSLALVHDTVMGAAAFILSLALRVDWAMFEANLWAYLAAAPAFGLLVALVGLVLGMNRGVWRYASLSDLLAIVKTASLSVAVFIVAHFLLVRLEAIPRSSIVIVWAFLIILLAAPRLLYRIYRDRRDARRYHGETGAGVRNVLLVGAGDNADLFLKMRSERGGSGYNILGIIDERGRRVGRFIQDVPVLGTLDKLPQLVERFAERDRRPDLLILTRTRDDYDRHASIEELVEAANREHLQLLRLPDLSEMRGLDHEIQLQPVRLEDLLQRPALRLDAAEIAAMIEDRVVLITGGGGSIGSELARQVAVLRPRRLVLLDASEYLLYSIESELRTAYPDLAVEAVLCNVREREVVARAIAAHTPNVLFHAAALKHVPIVESHPLEGIATNALGTRNVAEAAARAGVAAMILVSTDKAVNPANVMGATKRMAEMVCQGLDLGAAAGESGTRFVTVRFGNVLGSAGSVVPLFERQIKAGGPLTVTHPAIERYFMTIPEACLLVLQAAAHSLRRPGERGRIFVLDMGTPVKIVDLARNLIRLSGLRPEVDVRIVYTGLRPGEKLYEELFDARETLAQTDAAGILAASPRAIEYGVMARILDEMRRLIEANDVAGALRLLQSTVPDFVPGPETLERMRSERPAPPRLLAVPAAEEAP
ncbi:polysaccharide biosynthesis protein [Aureimonas leprariae]|uniref:Polysaccharide biosynthesis protein n=2 Tax=Plantimonas leprariae TaxID=2615207 RepID=A0A7V7PRT6_9HYPH|nr:polysaccharide biosynthesis protein [Aureimonas leprariae]